MRNPFLKNQSTKTRKNLKTYYYYNSISKETFEKIFMLADLIESLFKIKNKNLKPCH